MSDLVGGVAGGAIGARLVAPLVRRRARRLAEQSKVECSARVVSGDAPGLGRRWTHGVAHLTPAQVELSPFLPPGIRVRNPFRRSVAFDVQHFEVTDRRPKLSLWGPGPLCAVVTVATADGIVELAVAPSSLAVVERLLTRPG